jgi:hypothetical protein
MPGSNNVKPKFMRKKRTRSSLARYPNSLNPPSSTIIYRGPITYAPLDETSVVLFDSYDVSVVVATPYTASINNNPTSARNFSEYSTSWSHYRVLGIRFRYYPAAPVNTTATGSFFGVNSIVHGAVTTPASLAQAMSTGISRPWEVYKRFTRTWRMQEIGEAGYIPCGSPASTSTALQLYVASPGISQDLGTIMIEYLCQFKTHVL